MSDGSTSAYIGSTIRCLDIRIKEHLRSCRDRNIYSALALSTISGNQPIWEAASIIGHAKHTSLLRWKEALFIHSNPTINQPSMQLNPTILHATGLQQSTCDNLSSPGTDPGEMTLTSTRSRNSTRHHSTH